MPNWETQELIRKLRALWKKKQPFLMQMEVGAPYDGCWCEPNLFLVTPIGCELQRELMDNIPSRWGPHRERCDKVLHEARGARASAEWKFDWAWRQARGDRWGAADAAEAAKLPDLFDVLDAAIEEEIDAEVNYQLACTADPKPMKQPKLCVWPLYASGQGVAMDAVHSLMELVHVCEEESVYDYATRARWPDGLLGSRLVNDGTGCYGRITLVDVAPMGPINTSLPAGERYWLHALKVAQEQWGVTLTWKCEGCDSVLEYDEYEGRPEATGYHGDGGIGVHLTGVLCDQCLMDGACIHCREHDGDPMHYYSDAIKEHGWSLCEDCTEQLLRTCGIAGEVELPVTVELKWWKAPSQLDLPGIDVPPELRFCVDDVPVPGLTCDAAKLAEAAEEMDLEHLSPGGYGLALPGNTIENMAFKGVF